MALPLGALDTPVVLLPQLQWYQQCARQVKYTY